MVLSTEVLCYLVGGVMTLLVFFFGMIQLSRFYRSFCAARVEIDTNLISVVAQLKRLNTLISEMTAEQRRLARLTLEQIELKKAEMTGDFEIVEEPLPQAPAKK